MKTAVVVHPSFDRNWPYAADRLHELLRRMTDVSLVRVPAAGGVAGAVDEPSTVERLIALGLPLSEQDVSGLPALQEAYATTDSYASHEVRELLERLGVRHLSHPSEGFWAQSVAEFALGLTIAGLRRIPQTHHAIISGLEEWDYPAGQFGDDPRFANGTVQGKRVRVVGAGNIASRYASFTSMLGAEVAAWDPFAPEPAFHRAGARREWHLDRLLRDAEIFAPMVPLTPSTEALVTAAHIESLPTGCLVVLATRARICDTEALRRRVLADELSLAADVFDVEPLPLDDPLLGRHNVVHTPHNAGRTKEANFSWAEMLVEQLPEYDPALVPPRPAIPPAST